MAGSATTFLIPALIGRAFLLISFPKLMTIWNEPAAAFMFFDAQTTATPLGILKEEGQAKLIEIFGDQIQPVRTLTDRPPGGLNRRDLGSCAAYRRPISFLQGIYYMAYTRIISRNGCTDCLDFRCARSALCRRSSAASLERRHDSRRIFHGNRLCYLPIGKKWPDIFGIGCGFLTMLIRLKADIPKA